MTKPWVYETYDYDAPGISHMPGMLPPDSEWCVYVRCRLKNDSMFPPRLALDHFPSLEAARTAYPTAQLDPLVLA